MSAPIQLRGVGKRFGDAWVARAIDLDLAPGRITALLGPSGCGKTTLLRMIAGLEAPDEGEIRRGDERLSGPDRVTPPEARRIGLVVQDSGLFPHLNVAQNIGFGLFRLSADERRQRVADWLAQMQLEGLERRYPHMLSGGQQQRVALARAMAPEPGAILLDEPFSGLDRPLRAELRGPMLAALKRSLAPVLLVTHDADDALGLADEIALMHHGRILQIGSPEACYRRPVSAEAAALLGPINVVPASLAAALTGRPSPTDLLVRPEWLRETPNGAPALVERVEFAGSHSVVALNLSGVSLTMYAGPEPPAGGGTVRITANDAANRLK